MKRLLGFALACSLSVSFCVCGFAEEMDPVDVEYSYGTVVSVDKDAQKITVKEFNWDDKGEEFYDSVYLIAPDIKTENVSSWQEIDSGKPIDIEYSISPAGEKIVHYIYLYKDEEIKIPELE